MDAPNYQADGDIRPCRFLVMSGDFLVQESDADEYVCGVSQEGLRGPNTPDSAETLAAKAGEQIHVHGPGQYCLLELAETLLAGDLVKPDADGAAVAATLDAPVGAELLQGGEATDKVRARVVRHRADTIV